MKREHLESESLRQRLKRLAHSDDKGGARTKSEKRVRRPKNYLSHFIYRFT